MKKNILTIATFFIALTAFAQSSTDAHTILNCVSTSFEASNGVRLNFTLHIIESSGDTFQAQAGEAMIRQNRFKLAMDDIDVWFDGTTQWTLQRDIDEVYISTPTGDELATISPLALLGMYRSGFQLNAPVSQTVNGVSAHVIDMIPAPGNNDFRAVSVAISQQTNTLVQVNLTMQNGMQTRIDITNYNANHNFPDAYFVFNVGDFPGVEVIDLR